MTAEAAGVPSAALITEVFKGMAGIEASGLGIPDMRVVVFPHPVGPRSEAEIEKLVAERIPAIEEALGIVRRAPVEA